MTYEIRLFHPDGYTDDLFDAASHTEAAKIAEELAELRECKHYNFNLSQKES